MTGFQVNELYVISGTYCSVGSGCVSGKINQDFGGFKFLGFHLQITGLVISVIFYDNIGSQRRGFLLITSIQT